MEESVTQKSMTTDLNKEDIEMLISVKRDSDDKVFTTNMSEKEGIYEMHFCTSYTQVKVQELNQSGELISKDIICPPIGTVGNFVDMIAIQNDDTGIIIQGSANVHTIKHHTRRSPKTVH